MASVGGTPVNFALDIMSSKPPRHPTILRLRHSSFVAGTPVWTDKGLVSVERLKVGDLVLSKSEVTGEKAYKRVLRTFRTEDQTVRMVNFEGPIGAPTAASARGASVRFAEMDYEGPRNIDGSETVHEFIFSTANHPFWIKDRGWMTVKEIFNTGTGWDRWNLERAAGGEAILGFSFLSVGMPVFRDLQGYAFVTTENVSSDGAMGYSMQFDGETHSDDFDPIERHRLPWRRVLFHGASIVGDDLANRDLAIDVVEEYEFEANVYNIEVEDFYTYYVGELGVWVGC